MPKPPYSSALIVGAGPGLGASLARTFAREGGMRVMVAARQRDRLDAIALGTGAGVAICDSTDAASVAALFDAAATNFGAPPEVVVYNASMRVRGPFVDVDAIAMERAVRVTAYGAFLVAQQAARRMLPLGRGAILFTGASAGVKGYAQSAAFAMSKFALRGLAQAWRASSHRSASTWAMSSSTAAFAPRATRAPRATTSITKFLVDLAARRNFADPMLFASSASVRPSWR